MRAELIILIYSPPHVSDAYHNFYFFLLFLVRKCCEKNSEQVHHRISGVLVREGDKNFKHHYDTPGHFGGFYRESEDPSMAHH
jgi:hypothetical protein